MEPNTLTTKWLDKPMQIYRTGGEGLYPESTNSTRIPAGHPEGYLEAFATIYRNFAKCVRAKVDGTKVDPIYEDFPTVSDGVRGMKFVDKVVKSSKKGAKWVKL